MFQGPKGYIAQLCEVHLQYGNSTTKWPFYTFLHSNIYSILFGKNEPYLLKVLLEYDTILPSRFQRYSILPLF